MPFVQYAAREILCKIVYYGPARSGKTTNLQWLHRSLPDDRRTDLVSLATENDRTLFFDFLPLDLGTISGFRTKIQIYTVPGQIYYNTTRALVLRGADGVVFVADSQANRGKENMESLRNLQVNLREHGFDIRRIPLVYQYNKQDLPGARDPGALDHLLNFRDVPSTGAVAIRGEGVVSTLRAISAMVLDSVSRKYGAKRGA